jgi:FRG domain
MLNDLLNRTQAVFHRSDVWAALALAKEWQQEGRAQWFRGQVFPWPPRSSLLRWTNTANSGDTLSTEPTLYRFSDWAQQRPELSFIAAEISKLTAVAQHFGLPTNYVDFSVCPEVAAFFSRDRAPDSIYPSEEACIYCLNLDDMRNWFLSLDRAEAAEAQVWPESFDLPSLHRLTAQKGVFLHAPSSWDERFKPLCILFPRGPGLTSEERLLVYPPTSKLEEDVRAFLQAESTYEWATWIGRLRPGSVIRHRGPAPEVRDSCFANGRPAPCPGWPRRDSAWILGTHRPGGDTFTMRWPPQEGKIEHWMFAAATRRQFEQTLTEYPGLWRKSLQLEVLPTPGLLEDAEASKVSESLTRAWNGMDGFPYSGNQRLQSFERILLLGSAGLASRRLDREEKLRKMLSGSAENRDRWIELTLGGSNGASSTGLACFGALVDALRPDLCEIVSDEGRKLVIDDPIELMRRGRDPALIFDFESLVGRMVEDLIPTQVLLGNEELPVVFSPAQLDYLGPE